MNYIRVKNSEGCDVSETMLDEKLFDATTDSVTESVIKALRDDHIVLYVGDTITIHECWSEED